MTRSLLFACLVVVKIIQKSYLLYFQGAIEIDNRNVELDLIPSWYGYSPVVRVSYLRGITKGKLIITLQIYTHKKWLSSSGVK